MYIQLMQLATSIQTTLQEMKKCGFRMTPNDIRAFVLDKMDLSEDDR